MALTKVTYVDNQTVIEAAQLNAIQDELIRVGGLLGKDIQSATIDNSGHLILTLTDGTTLDAGVAKGAQGPKGATGPAGANGKSAYQYAVEGGFTGTETAFAERMAAEIPAVDTTLTVAGAAADAKAVGDALAGKQDSGNYVKSVNGTTPDASGNVTVEAGGGGSGIYVGDTAPSDTSMLWVDTSDNEGSTVDSVNGKTGTVVLTAEDVGAMPAGASTGYTLPVATAETLGGVKVGEGLSIDASGVLSASGGGSSGGGGGVPTWSLLGEYDMSTIADSANISLTGLDNLTNLYFKFEALQNGSGNDSNYWLSINGKQLSACIISKKSGTSIYGYSICKWNGLVWEIQMSAGAISDTNYNLSNGNALFPYNHAFGVGACTTLSVFVASSAYKAVSGVLKIYGGK